MSFNFNIKKRPNGKFSIRMRSYSMDDRLAAGKTDVDYVEKTLPEHEWGRYGFKPSMSIDEARLVIKKLNKSTKARDLAERKARIKVIESDQKKEMLKCAYLPEYLVTQFEKKLLTETLSMSDGAKNKRIYHWKTAMKTISKIGIAPEDWGDSRMAILVSMKGYAPSTVSKQVQLMNMYGSFYCKKLGKYYEPIFVSTGDLNKLGDHYLVKTNGRTKEGKGITTSDMEVIEDSCNLSQEEKDWCKVCIGLGLRPSELELIISRMNDPKVIKIKDKSVIIYQNKLTSLAAKNRYKEVLIKYKFQSDAVDIIKLKKKLKMPSLYMIRKVLGSDEYTRYSFRKGYEDIMFNLGESIERISRDLGHNSIERTWRNYRKKNSIDG